MEFFSQKNRGESGALPEVLPVSWAVIGLCALLLLVLVLTSPHHVIYDEGWYLKTVSIFREWGLSREFLVRLPGPAGPNFTVVYGLVEKLTGQSIPLLRLASAIMFFVSVALLARAALHFERIAQGGLQVPPSLMAAMLIAVPTVAASAGMALTEMPSVIFVCAGLWFLFTALDQSPVRQSGGLAGLFFLAGFAFGIAIAGRQNYLVILPCAVLLSRRKPHNILLLTAFYAGAGLVLVPLFSIWHGLVPPLSPVTPSRFVPWFGILSGGYAGLLTLIMAPRFFLPVRSWKAVGLTLLVALFLGLTFGEAYLPMKTLSIWQKLPALAAVVARLFSVLISAVSISFFAACAMWLWSFRQNAAQRFVLATTSLGVLSNGGIPHQFSSRYVFVFLPFLLFAVAPQIRLDRQLYARLLLGGVIGLMSLRTYLAG